MSGSATLEQLRRFAERLAIRAGAITLGYFQSGIAVETKSDRTPVTRADREAEAEIAREIHESYPDHAILGEESGYRAGSGDYTWVIDPIDGTKSFIAGVPLYTVLIALISGVFDGSQPVASDRVLVGVVHAPAARETVSAARGSGAVWSSSAGCKPARVAAAVPAGDARIATTDFGSLIRRRPRLAAAIGESGAMTRTWGDAYGYLLVATGRIDAMIDPVMNPWDVAPLPVIIEEAGGVLTDLGGDRVVGESTIAA
ncbi:MAG: hypothetical protein EA382_04565, partial [Spirochaetaceae bacterium]